MRTGQGLGTYPKRIETGWPLLRRRRRGCGKPQHETLREGPRLRGVVPHAPEVHCDTCNSFVRRLCHARQQIRDSGPGAMRIRRNGRGCLELYCMPGSAAMSAQGLRGRITYAQEHTNSNFWNVTASALLPGSRWRLRLLPRCTELTCDALVAPVCHFGCQISRCCQCRRTCLLPRLAHNRLLQGLPDLAKPCRQCTRHADNEDQSRGTLRIDRQRLSLTTMANAAEKSALRSNAMLRCS